MYRNSRIKNEIKSDRPVKKRRKNNLIGGRTETQDY